MSRIYGYARPLASAADADAQAQNLASAGAETIFAEKDTPHARQQMRERRRLLDRIGPGDTLILQSLDRLGTTIEDVLHSLAMLVERGVALKLLEPRFETAPDQSHRALLELLTSAHSSLRSESIKLNLATARARGGRKAGNPPTLTPEQWPDIEARIKTTSLAAIAAELNVSRQTLWAYRRRMTEQDRASTR